MCTVAAAFSRLLIPFRLAVSLAEPGTRQFPAVPRRPLPELRQAGQSLPSWVMWSPQVSLLSKGSLFDSRDALPEKRSGLELLSGYLYLLKIEVEIEAAWVRLQSKAKTSGILVLESEGSFSVSVTQA